MRTSPLECAVLQNTRQDFSVNNGNAVPTELMNADAVMNELMNALQPLRQHFPVSEDPVHRSRALRQAETAEESIT